MTYKAISAIFYLAHGKLLQFPFVIVGSQGQRCGQTGSAGFPSQSVQGACICVYAPNLCIEGLLADRRSQVQRLRSLGDLGGHRGVHESVAIAGD